VEQALRAGASGYLLKDAATTEIERAVTSVARDDIYLCPGVSKQLVESYLKRGSMVSEETMNADTADEIQLTARQREILQNIAEGETTKQIAHRLGISHKTVEAHRTQLMERLSIRDVPGLVRYAIRIGLVRVDK
jgi:DNA-binding NarL/FixJ family response regulator